MRLDRGFHLGYCTNIHRGEAWEETFAGLERHTDRVRQRVCPDEPYGIGLRLSRDAVIELQGYPGKKAAFARWLEEKNSYLFTVNGFPYGQFHGAMVKEKVYAPDWATMDRLEYTMLLFDFLAEMAPPGEEISVSTLPGTYKGFLREGEGEGKIEAIVKNLRSCNRHIEGVRARTGRDVHLGLEPEPLGLFENTGETIRFFERLHDGLSPGERQCLTRNIGVNYDTCHFAVEFEEAGPSIAALRDAGIRISKIHLSSALRLSPTAENVGRLAQFHDEVYLHQTLVRRGGEVTRRFSDIPDAVGFYGEQPGEAGDEWRVHFHIPLHCRPEGNFGDTSDQVPATLRAIAEDPQVCRHFEMETYTWEVLPREMRSEDVVDQLASEYRWCLAAFAELGFGKASV